MGKLKAYPNTVFIDALMNSECFWILLSGYISSICNKYIKKIDIIHQPASRDENIVIGVGVLDG